MTDTPKTCEQPWFVLNSSRYRMKPATHPAMSCFYALEVGRPADLTFAVPDGCVDILFDCDSRRPKAKVCGTPLQARQVELLHDHRYFGVRFQPGVIPGFVGSLAEELPEQEVDLCDVLPGAAELIGQIAASQSFDAQAVLFDACAGPGLAREISALTRLVIRQVLTHRGDMRIRQLEDKSGYTGRTLQRQFRHDTGLTPKTFCRIIRCQAALSSLATQQHVAFSELALELGFTDQSHFLRDFKALVSTTPSDYHRRVLHRAQADRFRG